MRFEERELRDYAVPVTADSLQKEHVYFSLQFADEELLIPILQPLVFLGKHILRGPDLLHFQNFESYCQGIRFDPAKENDQHLFQVAAPNSLNHIFEFEEALNILLMCSLRRRGLRA